MRKGFLDGIGGIRDLTTLSVVLTRVGSAFMASRFERVGLNNILFIDRLIGLCGPSSILIFYSPMFASLNLVYRHGTL